MTEKRKKSKIRGHGKGLVALAGGVATLAGIVISLKTGAKVLDGQKLATAVAEIVKAGGGTAKEVVKEAASSAPNNPRYIVQMRALKTGEWYTKTLTDSKPAAYSVATTCAGPRASRVIDTLEDIIKDVNPGDPSSYAQHMK